MTAPEKIDGMIAAMPDWRGDMLNQIRQLINETDSGLKEEWKWNTAVWTHNGLVCALSGFKNHVKINFFKGAHLTDKYGVINAGFDSKEHRAVDFYEGDTLDKAALQNLIRAAIQCNQK